MAKNSINTGASLRPQDKIKHVFVLMLENRSFDHMFANSGISGIVKATSANSNLYQGSPIAFNGNAPDQMKADPFHEFDDVVEQLCGTGTKYKSGKPYPARNQSGFADNYATAFKKTAPTRAEVATIMAGIDTPRQAPAMYQLAKQFALCDRWCSSLPGPTWPNRFFVHGASSAGLDHSPGLGSIVKWETWSGFKYPKGSVYDALGKKNCRFYQDASGPLSGRLPQVSALKGVSFFDVHDLTQFTKDLAGDYPYKYTFIEPAYGDVIGNSYRGGSSQHPMDGLEKGDQLVASVYKAIRNSPHWENSLLIVTYDEHGGFYDSVPPIAAQPPGDNPGQGLSKFGFDFSVYGVRVPAIVVSPWIKRGKIDPTLYDHSSVIKTLGKLFGFNALTDRDRLANDVLWLLQPTLRTDCPLTVGPAPGATAAALAGPKPKARPLAVAADAPVEDGTNLQAFLYLMRKAQQDSQIAVAPEVAAAMAAPMPETKGVAKSHLNSVMPSLLAERRARQSG